MSDPHAHGHHGQHDSHAHGPHGGHDHQGHNHHGYGHGHHDRAGALPESGRAPGFRESKNRKTLAARVRHLLSAHSHGHSHGSDAQADTVLNAGAAGMRALWISLAVLGATALTQAAVTMLSGSVALLGDTLHNAEDALTAVPLAIAFVIGRRPPTRRYTYGFGRAEDLAGIVIVAFMAASAAFAGYTAVARLLRPAHVADLIAVAAAALVGFAGNEVAAFYRIRTGRKIGSAALVADGLHARADGLSSLAVLLGAGGVALGWTWADPVAGLVITIAIAAACLQAGREVWRRLMDAVDPVLVDLAERTLRAAPGVLDVGDIRLRWSGHQIRGECEIVVTPDITAAQAHRIAVGAEHALLHAIPRLSAAHVHADPGAYAGDPHAVLADHIRTQV